ncbi:MAG: hypothetical protein OXT67_06160 [Zetaproteobacteria bacterium]|nr:hypothetical protein [Zetaproteobacteria bacterium]
MADIEYALSQFAQAGKSYEGIVDLGPKKAFIRDDKSSKKNIHLRSAKNMLDSYNKQFERELQKTLKRKPNFKRPALALSADAKNFIRACEKYLKFYGKDLKTKKNCEVFTTEIYFRNQNRKLSETNLWNLIRTYPGSKEGRVAVDNLIFLLSDQKQRMEQSAHKILKIPAYRKGEVGNKLRALLSSIEVERVAAVKDPLKRAGMFYKLAVSKPKGKDADKYLNNSAADYLKANRIHDALKSLQLLVRLYPTSSFYKPALAQLGNIHHGMFNLAVSIPFFIKYATAFPKEKNAPAALQQACLNAIALGRQDATNICLDFSRKFPKYGQFAVQSLLSYIWRTQQTSLYYDILTKHYITTYKVSPSERLILYYRAYKMADAGSAIQKAAHAQILRLGRSSSRQLSGEALRYYGELIFNAVQPQQRRFSKLKLQGGTVDALQRSIEANFNSLLQLEASYKQVFATQDSYWGVASFYNIGIAYERMGELLKNPPAIKGVPRQDLVNQLDGSVQQVMNKAKEYYSGGLQAVRRYAVFNQWSVKIYNALNRVSGRANSMEEIVVAPDFIASEISADVQASL